MKRINLKKKKHLRMQVLFLAPRTGLEPVTSQSAVMLPFAVPGKRRGIRRSVSPTAALRRSPFLCHRQRELSSPPTELPRNIELSQPFYSLLYLNQPTSQSAVMLPFAVPGKRRAYAAPFLRPLHFVDLPSSATGSGRSPHHRLSYRGILLYRCLYGLSEAV